MKHRLAVAYDVDCFSPIEIVTAVGEQCDLIWVVNTSQTLGPMGRMLGRTGTVLDIAELAPEAAIARVGDARPEGIVAFSDSQLATASAIAAGLGLRCNPPPVTRLFLDKYEQRIALRAAGIAVPGFTTIPAGASGDLVVSLTAGLEFPVVMKPRHGSGSRDTYRVESADALVELLAPNGRDQAAAINEYVVEEYIPDSGRPADGDFGDYVSVESVVVDGKARHLSVTGKFPLTDPFRETGNFMPCSLLPEQLESVTALADEVITALGVDCGCLHTEIKMSAAGPRIIESNARVGGGGTDHLFLMSYGESLLYISVMTALGIDIPTEFELRAGAVAYQLFFQSPVTAQRLVRMEGLEQISSLPGVEQLFLNRQPGDETDWRDGSQGYVLAIRGSVADHDALRRLRAQITQRLNIVYS